MKYLCCDQLRRSLLLSTKNGLNGLDYLEVSDPETGELSVHFLKDLPVGGSGFGGSGLAEGNFRIYGGVRITDIEVTNGAADAPKILKLQVNWPGDLSRYILRLVKDQNSEDPPTGFDPEFTSLEFSFKPECHSHFDCKQVCTCVVPPKNEPEIDYLAKDYHSFRRVLLDRMSLMMPAWHESSPADLGTALIELLAYVGDNLSYEQDAVATEAYIGTARRRISVRRHALLMDYSIQEGSNARTWIRVQVDNDNVHIDNEKTGNPLGTTVQFLTRVPGLPFRISPGSHDSKKAMAANPIVFEPMDNPPMFKAHNLIQFYTWRNNRCCLPQGATGATLKGNLPNLRFTNPVSKTHGSVLIFEEARGPKTGEPGDADPAHRHAVRLTNVKAVDESGANLTDPLTGAEITEVEWSNEDALPFPLCISSATADGKNIQDVTIAYGNVVLADHGQRKLTDQVYPDTVPKDTSGIVGLPEDRCAEEPTKTIPSRYRPILEDHPLTFAGAYDPFSSATASMNWDPRDATPQVWLTGSLMGNHELWGPVRDLLNSRADSKDFVPEIENDGLVHIRFGDNELGKRPDADTVFTAECRIGNGKAGNVGRNTLFHIVTNDARITEIDNPLAARGGLEPESIEEVRTNAPEAFETQERAVTLDDYETKVTELETEIKRAAASYVWTGSWHTVFLTVDRQKGLPVDKDKEFAEKIRSDIERYRMAGYDLEVDAPIYVSLDVEMAICVDTDFFRADVEQELRDKFSNRMLPDGTRGFFQPENFTFGQTIYLSNLYSIAQGATGVVSVQITKFEKQGEPSDKYLHDQSIKFDRLEIPRLDNDPNFPEHGILTLIMAGGK